MRELNWSNHHHYFFVREVWVRALTDETDSRLSVVAVVVRR
jgi:hypothetical protein